MTTHTDIERAEFERELIDNHHYVPSDFIFKDGFYDDEDDDIQFAWEVWQAARRAPSAEPAKYVAGSVMSQAQDAMCQAAPVGSIHNG